MRGYFGLGQLSATEKSDILDQHKSLYNGYQTMQPQVSNTQPLYVFDSAGDKDGLVVNNKGEVKKYTNMGINEQVKSKEMCEQCGGRMTEGICEQCAGTEMEEATGKLDDIYDEEDLNPSAGFDYIEGSSNDVDTFEKMHKNLYEGDDFEDYESSYTEDGVDDPDNEDDGFEDMNSSEVTDGELDELGIADLVKGKKYKYNHPLYPDEFEFDDEHKYETGSNMYSFRSGEKGYAIPGKHVEDFVSDLDDEDEDIMFEYDADDMDVSDVKPAYDFESDGPGDVYPVNELDEDDMYGYDPEKMYEFDEMESAWAEEELEEQPDISGVQGIYGDMGRAYDFTSDGPGKGGPYQEFSYESELDEDEEFTSTEDDFEEVDEDLKESFLIQKNKITEMFNRFNRYN